MFPSHNQPEGCDHGGVDYLLVQTARKIARTFHRWLLLRRQEWMAFQLEGEDVGGIGIGGCGDSDDNVFTSL